MGCMTLLYATWMTCFFNSANLAVCDTQKNFRPVYTMWDCRYCSKDVDLMIQMRAMIENNEYGLCGNK